MKTQIPFYKAHGTGNDFIIFFQEECPKIITNPDFIFKICQRRTGIGADGVIIISDISSTNFKMDYFNSDGTWETFCANGARCVGKILSEKKQIGQNPQFIAGDGEHQLKFENNGDILVKMKSPVNVTKDLNLFGFSGKYVDSGAKHFVCEAKELTEKIANNFGPKIRYSEIFAPHGVNVNFAKTISSSEIRVITYEKGIEKVMLSCGSGSVAAAFYLNEKNNLNSPLKIKVPGGNLNLTFDKNWDDVWLGGQAVILFQSEINHSI